MAATNPFKVTDLVSKYGWQFLGYMANLGVNVGRNAQVIFVDSAATNTLDADDTEHGHSFDKPVATLDYAIGLCTDGQGDVILVAPGHTENLDSATACVVDISDLTIVGLGTGMNRPTFSFSETAGIVSVTAANVTIKNCRFVSSKANVVIGISAAAGADGLWLEDCYFSDGNHADKELLIAISLANTCDDVTILNCDFHTTSGGDCTAAIFATSANDRLRIEGCHMYGEWSASCIDANATTLHLEIDIKDNVLVNQHATGIAIELYTGTTGALVRNMVAQTTDTVDAAITGDDAVYEFENYECDAVAKHAIIIPAAACA